MPKINHFGKTAEKKKFPSIMGKNLQMRRNVESEIKKMGKIIERKSAENAMQFCIDSASFM